MRRQLSVERLMALHKKVIAASGGSDGLRDRGALDAAAAQPEMSFDGELLYPTLPEQAAALGFSLLLNHPFVDGNKRIAHAAMETYLALNDLHLVCEVDEQERVILAGAAGQMEREEFTEWVREHTQPLPDLPRT